MGMKKPNWAAAIASRLLLRNTDVFLRHQMSA
jgi:hypothetical protein